MQGILNTLSLIMDAFGAVIVVPVVLFVLNLIMRVPGKKAFLSSLNASIGLTGVNLNILNTGRQATTIVASHALGSFPF